MPRKKNIPVPTLFKLWHSKLSTEEICKKLGIHDRTLSRLTKKHGLSKRPNKYTGKSKTPDPTPEELAQRALEVQAKWTESEREQRYRGSGRREWKVPRYNYHADNNSFSIS